MKIIKDETKYECIVKCRKCGSIFSYNNNDLDTEFAGRPKVTCPCCSNKDECWNFKELNIGE